MGEEEDIMGDAFPGVGEGRAAGCEGCGISFGSGWCRLTAAAAREEEEVGGSALLIGIDDGIVTLFVSRLESSVEEMLAVGVGAFIPTSASGTCHAFSIFLFVLQAERAAGACPAVLTTGALVVMLLVLLVGADASTVLPDVEFVVVTLVVAVAVGGCCPCGLGVG